MRARWVVLAATGLLLAGCSGTTEGTAVADAPKEPWDPCSIPADAIAETGLNPETEEQGWGKGIAVDDWERCVWLSSDTSFPYSSTIMFTTEHSVDEFRNNPQYTSFEDTTADERPAIKHGYTNFDASQKCGIAVPTSSGLATLSVRAEGRRDRAQSLCAIVADQADKLAGYLPA